MLTKDFDDSVILRLVMLHKDIGADGIDHLMNTSKTSPCLTNAVNGFNHEDFAIDLYPKIFISA